MDDAAPTCYRHPGVETRITCQRCERPICPECMIPGAVGFQCPECVDRGHKETRQLSLPYGGERSKNPRVTTLVLIGINAAIFILIQLVGVSNRALTNTLALMPANRCQIMADGTFFTSQQVCETLGMTWGYGLASEPWQLITSGFTHVEAMHILFNMAVLYMLGPNLEAILGRARFLAVYLIALIGGSASVMLFTEPWTQTLGASGAIYGILGAYLIAAIKHRGDPRTILMWLTINIAFSFIFANVSWQGHIGGLVAGTAATAIIMLLPKEWRRYQWLLLGLLAVALVAVAFVRAAALA